VFEYRYLSDTGCRGDMTTRVQKVGDSLAVLVPQAIADQTGLTVDAEVDVTSENGAVVARASRQPRYTLDALLRQITPENVHPETATGPAVGNELL
jgi:antitoxin MazE